MSSKEPILVPLKSITDTLVSMDGVKEQQTYRRILHIRSKLELEECL